uniref:Putative ABC transporter involved in Fe-S cluster assembly, SufD n=1 Tax=Magnetococcus massalia (strain MO-1) TaxID=451514 RepID=A0A1S7LH28_MAGMO|nr:putative ABC transporter involved in Fe-S cluster assembly, SufD [Candidatus Magnetococcus massalia]
MSPATRFFLSACEEAQFPGDASWLRAFRAQQLARFNRLGVPDRKREAWRYSPMHLFHQPVHLPEKTCLALIPDDLEPLLWSQEGGPLITLVNGRFQPQLSHLQSLPQGVVINSLGRQLEQDGDQVKKYLQQADGLFEEDPFALLEQACLQDGLYLQIPSGVQIAEPVHLLHLCVGSEEATWQPMHHLVVAGSASQLTLVEHYATLNPSSQPLIQTISQVWLGQGAVVDHLWLQQEGHRTKHLSHMVVQQKAESQFTSHTFSLGGLFARHQLDLTLAEQGAQCQLFGLIMADEQRQGELHIQVDHRVPHTSSSALHHGLLAGRGKGVFRANVTIHPDAQQSQAVQRNANLLLSPTAEVDTLPQLRVLADDVSCRHGASVGELDREALLYLRSRGLGEDEAKRLMVHAFTQEIIGTIGHPKLKTWLDDLLLQEITRSHVNRQAAGLKQEAHDERI